MVDNKWTKRLIKECGVVGIKWISMGQVKKISHYVRSAVVGKQVDYPKTQECNTSAVVAVD